MLGQLDDAGNTTTLAHYLDLLEGAGMACGLPKYMGQVVRQRASSPKLQVFNKALMGCHWVAQGVGLQAAQARPDVWGRLAERPTAVATPSSTTGTTAKRKWTTCYATAPHFARWKSKAGKR